MDKQFGLFETDNNVNSKPLAYRLRPENIDYFFGQSKIKNKFNSLNIENIPHIILWGPPGTGKTTLSKILAQKAKLQLFNFNAVLGGVNDLRKIIQEALTLKSSSGIKSAIFIDEIHRFNKAQQDALLPYLEAGDFVLFGATTEYPQTSLNKAILSRVQLWAFEKLDFKSLLSLLDNAVNLEKIKIDRDVLEYIANYCNGDARSALNELELIINHKGYEDLSIDEIKTNILNVQRKYDKNSERHYDVISAFIKSIRGSDTNAAILWLAVMIDGGETPEFIARRLIISASEDIGNADPRALQVATSCHYSIKNIGMPEARIILAQATTYLAQAPKSNSSYLAIDEALSFVKNNPTIEVPTHLRNHHPDKKNYKYPHSFSNHWTEQDYQGFSFNFFTSSNIGYERMQKEYLDKIKRAH